MTNIPEAFNTERGQRVIYGIFSVLMSGAAIDREFIVKRFMQGGYGEAYSIRLALALIELNTDTDHWTKWNVFGTIPGKESYRLKQTHITLLQGLNP